MDGAAIISVSAAVVALTSLVKWAGLRDSWGPLVVIGFSALGTLLWSYSHDVAFSRHLVFDYFSGWIAVTTSAAGVFGFTRSIPAAVVTGSPMSTIPGAAQNPTTKPSGDSTERRG